MALKDIFTMVKADKYTQDGREEVIKAQQAETEDKVYQIGEISQKTGLQKTANGWVKPKTGKAPGTKENAESKPVDKGDINPAESEYNSAHARLTKLKATSPELQNDFEDHRDIVLKRVERGQPLNEAFETYEKEMKASVPRMVEQDIMSKEEGDRYIKAWEDFKKQATSESKPAAETKSYINKEGHRNFRAALEDNPTSSYDFEKTVKFAAPMSQEDKTELKKLQLFMSDEGADYKQALRSRASNLVDGNKSNGDWFPEKEKSIMKIAKAVGYDKELHKFIEEEYKGYDLGYSEDSAPRVLTGDTKIRVRKA